MLILSSCDFGNPESAKIIYNNLHRSISDYKVLYFPNEKATPDRIKSGKYEERVAAFGFQKKNILVADYFNPEPYLNIDTDIVYISGGNTFGTLKLIRDAGFDKAIVNYVQNGVLYIGGSAGAHIATIDISHVAKYDKDTFGLTNYSGLGLYNGILICHYTESRRADLEQLEISGKYTVRSLTDTDSIVVR